jgi:hypothetical protein
MFDVKALGESIVATVRQYVDSAVAGLAERLVKLEEALADAPLPDVREVVQSAVAEAIAAIPAPKDGKDADPVAIQRLVAENVAQAVKDIPVPKDGISVTLEDVQPLVAESVAKAVSELPKPKDGEDGKPIPIEEVQRLIDAAMAKAMESVRMPKDGEPGRDGAHIEILPAIDSEKAYPRGCYAKHAGGLWRSFEATTGMKGWECIVEGVAVLRIEREGDRGFKAIAELSSGAKQETDLHIPAMIYQGVFKEGTEYSAGDTVTWGGSLWHCDDPTTDKPGEPRSKSWTLAAKRGRDGKDAPPVIDASKAVKA